MPMDSFEKRFRRIGWNGKKRDVVGEELEKYHILENNIELTDNTKEIEVDLDVEKEVGDD